jgi:hypothetical protein
VSLGEKLIEAGLLTSAQWEEAEAVVGAEGGFVGAILVERGIVPAEVLSSFLERAFNIPTIAPGTLGLDPETAELASTDLWRRLGAVPVSRKDQVLTVAVARPLNAFVLHQLKRELGLSVRPVFADAAEIEQQLLGLPGPSPEVAIAPGSAEHVPAVAGEEPVESPGELPDEIPGSSSEGEVVGVAQEGAEEEAAEVAWDDADKEVAPEPTEVEVQRADVPGPRGQPDDEAEAACPEEVLAAMRDGPGWVAVIGDREDRVSCLRNFRARLEGGGTRVVYFSSAERPYGELESAGDSDEAVLMVEDLDELEGHVPEQALLLQEIRRAHARGAKLLVSASAPPVRLVGLEPGLRVAVSLARVCALGKRPPAWLSDVLGESVEVLRSAGLPDAVQRVVGRLKSGDGAGAVADALDACKSVVADG